MSVNKSKIGHTNFEKFSAREQNAFFKERIGFKEGRPNIIRGITDLWNDNALDFGDTMTYLEIITQSFFSNARESGSQKWQDRYRGLDGDLCRLTGHLVSCLPTLKNPNKAPVYYEEGKYYDPENIKEYYAVLDKIINDNDQALEKEKKRGKFSFFTKCVSLMSKHLSGSDLPYNGTNVKISSEIGLHGPSIILLPENPQNAVAKLWDDNIRTLFAEFEEEKDESAETFINKYYGTDGEYGRHYQTFINCKERYPNLKGKLS